MAVEQTKYIDQHLARVNKFEQQFLNDVVQPLHALFVDTATILRSHGLHAAINSINRIILAQGLAIALRRLYTMAGLYAAGKTEEEINNSIEKKAGFSQNQNWINALIQYFTDDYLSTVGGITSTVKDMILSVLIEGEKNGRSIEQMAAELESPKLSIIRARLIIRTELAKAYSDGKDLAQRESKFELVETWTSAHDELVRHSHRYMDGQQIRVGARFKVPIYKSIKGVDVKIGVDLMRHPGDKTADIRNIANCRCASFTRAARDKNGRLIRKLTR